MPPRILVIGSSNTDLVLTCSRLPRPGETLLGGDFQQFPGGKGANQAVAAARAGGQVTFLGGRGEDAYGRASLAALRREGVNTRLFTVRKDLPSGVALILLGGKSRENMIGVAHSANDAVSPSDIRAASAEVARSGAVLVQLEIPLPAVAEAARLCREHGVPLILNPAPARPLPRSLLRRVHLLTPNEHEAAALTGASRPEAAARALLAAGCAHVVITLGSRGALLATSEGIRRFPAPEVKPVDTVGAGDCFSGWLAVGVAERMPLSEAVRRALRAASLSVTRPGAQSAMPRRDEIER